MKTFFFISFFLFLFRRGKKIIVLAFYQNVNALLRQQLNLLWTKLMIAASAHTIFFFFFSIGNKIMAYILENRRILVYLLFYF